MKVKKLAYLSIVIGGTMALAACGTNDDATGTDQTSDTEAVEQTFKMIEQQEMPSADPSLATDVIGARALTATYEGLYRLGLDSEPTAAGALEIVEPSEDGLTYRFDLREESMWSNGDPVTANDYVFSWQRTVDPETGSEYASIFSPVLNAEAITAGEKDKSELGVKAVSDYELEVVLEKPVPYFNYLLAFKQYFPQNRKIVEEHGKEFATSSEKAVYNGPFVLADFDGPGTDSDWAYVKNDTYWDKDNVQLDRIDVTVIKESSTALNLYQAGELEEAVLTGELAQQMASDPELVIEKLATTFYLELNQREANSPFRNVNLRKALAYAIDRDALSGDILGDGSVASRGLIPADMSYSTEGNQDFADENGNFLAADAAKAKEHWETAKSELGIDSLEIELLSSDTDSSKKVVEYIQGAIGENLEGVKVNLSPVPFAVRLERSNKGEFDLVLGGWSADYADPITFIELFRTDSSYNRGKYSSAAYDKQAEESATTNVRKPIERWQNLLEAEKLLMDEMGVIPLYQNAEARLRTATLKDVAVHSTGARYDYKWAYKVAE